MPGPFDRFNDRAKRVLALAQDEAIRLNHSYIGPEHLLLGLVREGEGVAARVLESLGIDLSKLRMEIELRVGRGSSTGPPTTIVLAERTKKVIELAVEEAKKLGHSHVGTEHLLLGIAIEMKPDDVVGQVMAAFGASFDQARERTIGALLRMTGPHGTSHDDWVGTAIHRDTVRVTAASGRGGMGPFDRFTDGGKRILALAQDEAIRLNHNYVGTEHLLAALVRDADGVGARALTALGADLSKVRSALEFIIGRGDTPATPSEITLSPRTKKVIELAIDEARKLGHTGVGPGHILLGIVREGEGIASGIIESLKIPLSSVRQKVLELMAKPDQPSPPP